MFAVDLLDSVLLRAQFGVVPRIKDRSWRLGLAAERHVRSIHEGLRRTARRANWLSDNRRKDDAEVNVSGLMPAYPDFAPRAPRVSENARLLVSGRWQRADGSIQQIDELSWVADAYGTLSSLERLSFHSLRWSVDLFDAFDTTNDRNYLRAGLSLVNRWIQECLDCEDSDNIWSDHATALRAIVLCQAWHRGLGAELLDAETAQGLEEAAVRHARKLALSCFYRPDHDHGVTQAYAQLALGLCFRQAVKARAWTAQGVARLERQMHDNVSSEGILKEHSPYYQLYVLQQFYAAYELALAAGLSFSAQFVDRLSAMAAAAVISMKPDGTLAAFGDTSKSSHIVIDPASLLNTLAASDDHTETMARIWTEGGYALFRSGCNPAERVVDERFLMVRLATFPMPHVHNDVLSFEFYGHGDDLVVDSGGPFQYAESARTAYFTTVAAHNSIAIEGADQDPVGRARVISSESSPHHDVLIAELTAPGVVHTRALCFAHSGYLLLVDVITCSEPRTIRSRLHLNPALHATLEENCMRTRRSCNGPTVSVLPLHASTVTASLVRGERTPLQGWICSGEAQMTPGTVLEYRTSGEHVVFASVIVAEAPRTSSVAKATVTGNLAEFSATIVVDFGDHEDEITLSRPWSIRFARNITSHLIG
jgi:Heparinase II/III-like protein/Heparinase II/III N-terminus